MAPKKGETSQKGKGKAKAKASRPVDTDSDYVDEDLGTFDEPHEDMLHTPTSKKKVITKKAKESDKAFMLTDDVESDSEYLAEEDVAMFEDPPTYILQVPTVPTQKKRKGSSEPSFFCNPAAQKRWEGGMIIKKLHYERGFIVEKGPFTKLMKFHRFDQKLVSAPEHCNVSLAREFYTNAKFPNKDGAFYVRGKWVELTSEIINTHLGTPRYPTNPFHVPVDDDTADQAILKDLAHPGATWVRNQQGDSRHIRHQYLKSDVKLWLMFVLSRLMPSSQLTEVVRTRLYLISTIRERCSIDVGRIIYANIKAGINMDNAALYFPVLIQEICSKQGVDVEVGDWRRTKFPIATPLYSKYLKQDKEMIRRHLEGAGVANEEMVPPVYVADQGQQPYNFQAFHDSLHEFQHSVDTRFQQVDERLEGMHEMINDMQQGWNSTADTLVHRLDDMSSIAQQQFEVLYHRQVVMQTELDRCNKMSVYYHSHPGPPKPPPTGAQLAGYRVPNLTSDDITGDVHELPPRVPARSSFPPLPTFGRIPQMPPTPNFIANPKFMPEARIPRFGTGQPLQ